MGILDSGEEKELQQEFLSKADQNKEWSQDLGFVLMSYRYIDYMVCKSTGKPISIYGRFVAWGEDCQINNYGASKDRFQKSLESLSQSLEFYKNKGIQQQ